MKEWSLYAIRDLALSSGRAVFSVQQLSHLIGKSRAIAAVYSARMVEKGLAKRVLKGRISFASDEWVLATQLVEPSYISLDSALLFHGVAKQVPKSIECITPKNSFRFDRLGVTYHKVPRSLFFGYQKHDKGNSYVLVAEPEKAMLDGLYLRQYSKKDLLEYGARLDLPKLGSFLKRYKGRGSKKLRMLIGHD